MIGITGCTGKTAELVVYKKSGVIVLHTFNMDIFRGLSCIQSKQNAGFAVLKSLAFEIFLRVIKFYVVKGFVCELQ